MALAAQPCHGTSVRLVATTLWLAYVVSSYVFGRDPQLLTCSSATNCFDAMNLQSSGGDDDVLISGGFIVGMAPLVVSLWRWRRPIYSGEIYGWLGFLAFQLFWAMLIEVGSIYDTVRYGGNVSLLVWCLALLGLATIVASGLTRRASTRIA